MVAQFDVFKFANFEWKTQRRREDGLFYIISYFSSNLGLSSGSSTGHLPALFTGEGNVLQWKLQACVHIM